MIKKILLFLLALICVAAYLMFIYLTKSWIIIIILALSVCLTCVANILAKSIRKKCAANPKLTHYQMKEAEKAHIADQKARSANLKAKEKSEFEWQQSRSVRLKEIDAKTAELTKQLVENNNQLKDQMVMLNKMDSLCDDDKNLQVIDMLIHFINNRRADSIKEALQEYDKLLVNQQLLKMEQQKLDLERQKAYQEHQDRMEIIRNDERYHFEMLCEAQDSAQNRERIANQLDILTSLAYRNVSNK